MQYMHGNKGSYQGPIDDMSMYGLKYWQYIVPYDGELQIYVGLYDISVKTLK